METLDTVVIGAGVVGLAVARELALQGRDVVVLETENSFGRHASSRNSEVIHAGIYYPRGSLKAQCCVTGRELLYAYCAERGIPHRRIGKLLVAVEADEIDTLARYCASAAHNGVTDIRMLEQREWRELEPAIDVVAAALSPSTGIIDSHAFMLALLGDLEAAGASVVFSSPVTGGNRANGMPVLYVGGISNVAVRARSVINCAGLRAPQLAVALGVAPRFVPQPRFARGRYYTLAGASPFKHLVYPMPTQEGLGIHVTLDLGGSARFGPDVDWIDAIDYAFGADARAGFISAIARYYPDIARRDIHPDYCGIRPKIAGPGEAAADFMVTDQRQHGVAGLINLFGIESPGLTAALALAQLVAQRAAQA
jgi:L-2-hydroxyglutarate oxidase LhgO